MSKGTPRPTQTPIMILLSTPPTSPRGCSADTVESPEDAVGGGGVYDVGDPDVASMDFLFVPKATGVATPVPVDAGKVASTPEATDVMWVRVLVTLVVVCKDAGQFTKPVVKQPIPVKVAFETQ